MQRFRIVHEFEARPEDFWELFFREDYNRAFYAAVDVELEVLSDVRDASRIVREVRYRSTQPVPAIMRPFLPDGLGYTERSTFDRAAARFEHTIEPSTFGDRTEIKGEMVALVIAPGRIRRVYTGSVSIRVPVMGGRFEAGTITSMERTNDVAAAVTAQWLARRAAA
jgi:hypothetical protein